MRFDAFVVLVVCLAAVNGTPVHSLDAPKTLSKRYTSDAIRILDDLPSLAKQVKSASIDGFKPFSASIDKPIGGDGRMTYKVELGPESWQHFQNQVAQKGTLAHVPENRAGALVPLEEIEQEMQESKGVASNANEKKEQQEHTEPKEEEHVDPTATKAEADPQPLPLPMQHKAPGELPQPLEGPRPGFGTKRLDEPELKTVPDASQMTKLKVHIPLENNGGYISLKAKYTPEAWKNLASGKVVAGNKGVPAFMNRLEEQAGPLAEEIKGDLDEAVQRGVIDKEEADRLRQVVDDARTTMARSAQSIGHTSPADEEEATQEWMKGFMQLNQASRDLKVATLRSLSAKHLDPDVGARPAPIVIGDMEKTKPSHVEVNFDKRDLAEARRFKKRDWKDAFSEAIRVLPEDKGIAEKLSDPFKGYNQQQRNDAAGLANYMLGGERPTKSFRETAVAESALLQRLYHPSSDKPDNVYYGLKRIIMQHPSPSRQQAPDAEALEQARLAGITPEDLRQDQLVWQRLQQQQLDKGRRIVTPQPINIPRQELPDLIDLSEDEERAVQHPPPPPPPSPVQMYPDGFGLPLANEETRRRPTLQSSKSSSSLDSDRDGSSSSRFSRYWKSLKRMRVSPQ